MNKSRLMSLLSESSVGTDGKQDVSRRPKRKDDKEGYEFDKLSQQKVKDHSVNVESEDEYDPKVYGGSQKQSRGDYDHSKNGDKNPESVDGKFGKMGGHGGSTKRAADKTDGDKAMPKLKKEHVELIKRVVSEKTLNEKIRLFGKTKAANRADKKIDTIDKEIASNDEPDYKKIGRNFRAAKRLKKIAKGVSPFARDGKVT